MRRQTPGAPLVAHRCAVQLDARSRRFAAAALKRSARRELPSVAAPCACAHLATLTSVWRACPQTVLIILGTWGVVIKSAMTYFGK
jgi:hypothetical protein